MTTYQPKLEWASNWLKDVKSLYIGGQWVEGHGQQLESVNPATGQIIGRFLGADGSDVDRAVAAARDAFDHGPWISTISHKERGVILRRRQPGYGQFLLLYSPRTGGRLRLDHSLELPHGYGGL